VQLPSTKAKPDPEIAMTELPGPEDGLRVITCGIRYRVALAETGVVSVTVIVSVRPEKVTGITNDAVNVKSAATHTGTANGEPVTAPDAPIMVHAPAVPKLVPVTVTVLPTRAAVPRVPPGVSVCEICGTTWKLLEAESVDGGRGCYMQESALPFGLEQMLLQP